MTICGRHDARGRKAPGDAFPGLHETRLRLLAGGHLDDLRLPGATVARYEADRPAMLTRRQRTDVARWLGLSGSGPHRWLGVDLGWSEDELAGIARAVAPLLPTPNAVQSLAGCLP